MIKTSYRPDIDGLRFISIIAVILYHLKVPGFAAGFLGVDIFFVISGYLMTNNIMNGLQQNKFSILGFWQRRIRRLVPTFLALAIVTALVGYLLLLPEDFAHFGQSLAYQAFSISNFLFVRESGYFDAPSDFKPLLHTWSLAVEEQFYFILPILLIALSKIKKNLITPLLCTIFFSSLAAYIYWSQKLPIQTFFLPQFRIWELLAGSLVAQTEKIWLRNHRLSHFIAYLGMALILVGFFAYDKAANTQGNIVIMPVLGASLLLYSNSIQTLVHKIISLRLFTWIGERSYSLYLWHWPLIVFYVYYQETLTNLNKAILFLFVFIFGEISYRLIERPFRLRISLLYPKTFIAFSLASLLCLGILGYSIFHWDGMRGRFNENALAFAGATQDRIKWWEDSYCKKQFVNDPIQASICVLSPKTNQDKKILVWGNSHMGHLLPALEILGQKYGATIYFPSRNCPWFLAEKEDSICAKAAHFILEKLKQEKFHSVIYAGHWNALAKAPHFSELLNQSIKNLVSSKVPVWIVKQIPFYPYPIPKRLALNEHFNNNSSNPFDAQYFRTHHLDLESTLEKEIKASVTFLDPVSFLCPNNGDCLLHKNGHSLYSDSNHLSIKGSTEVLDMLKPVFE